MNILLLSQFFSTTKGGGEYVFKTIAETLEKNGHKIWVVTSKVKGEKYLETDRLKIIALEPELRYQGGLPPSFSDNIRYVLNAYRKARKLTKTEEIDIIHSNNFSPAIAGSVLSYFAKIPHITTIHDIFSVYDKKFWKKWAQQSETSYTNARLVPLFEKMMLRLRLDAIHTVSDTTRKDILKIGTKKPIHVIPNCIQEEPFEDMQPKDKQFVYLGRLVFYKNLEVILRALKTVKEQFPDVKLIIAGDGPHKQQLQVMAKKLKLQNNVTFEGYVTPDQKRRFLAESNALLFPSTTEGFGLVMLEAFQQKRPVLVSDIPPMSDIVKDRKTGFVIPYNDEKEWAKKIIHLINNPEISNNMGKEGNKILKEKYSQESFYQDIIKMYKNAID